MVLKKGKALEEAERKWFKELKERDEAHERWLKKAHERFLKRKRAEQTKPSLHRRHKRRSRPSRR